MLSIIAISLLISFCIRIAVKHYTFSSIRKSIYKSNCTHSNIEHKIVRVHLYKHESDLYYNGPTINEHRLYKRTVCKDCGVKLVTERLQ